MDFDTSEKDEAALLTIDSFRQPDHLVESAWLEHAPFLSWLIAAQRPSCFAELGSHHGYSYFTACQSVKQLGLRTACFAVDTWQGDEQAGFYGEEVFAAVRAHNETHFQSFSQLIRTSFDDAVTLFADHSIDLLHIDGRHFYEDVSKDFATWRPKLTPEGIVLLHDTIVRENDFGVYRLFDQLRNQYPTYEFLHGHGLGVIALGRIPSRLRPLFDSAESTRNFLHVAYSSLGRSITDRWQMTGLRRRDEERNEELARITSERQQALAHLTNQHGEAIAWLTREHQEELQSTIADRQNENAKTSELVAGLKKELAAREDVFKSVDALREAQAAAIQRLRQTAKELGQELSEAKNEVKRLDREQKLLVTSSSWRLTQPLRSFFARYPRSKRLSFAVARLTWWLVTFRLGRIVETLQRRLQLRRDEQLLAADPMFNEVYYRRRHYTSPVNGWSPMRHYLLIGRYEMGSPHPLFDIQWYLDNNPDVTKSRVDPLLHYIRRGRAERRSPNPYFDSAWYMRQYADAAIAETDPVRHFVEIGAAKGFDPSPVFNTKWYLEHYPDVAAAGINPLEHFLEFGRNQGRVANAYEVDMSSASSVIDTPIECRKEPILRREVAIFVTHSPHGRLKPHVRGYIESLARNGIGVTLVVASDRGFNDDDAWLYELLDGLYIRANRGWDFACWVHVLRLNRRLFAAETLYWLNDSVIGPTTEWAFKTILERIRASTAALVGLTANHERGRRHLQSYFLAIKRQALTSLVFQEFVQSVRCLEDKDDVINAYEIRFSCQLEAANLAVEALYEPNPVSNPTIYNWKQLLDEGFPFLKVLAIDNDVPGVDKSDWREVLQRHGYDVRIADRLLLEREDLCREIPAPVTYQSPPLGSREITFIGPWNYGNGLGVASRGYVGALMNSGLPVNILPIERPFHVHQRVAPTLGSTECAAPPGIAIVHLNPESWPALLTPDQTRLIDCARHRIGAFVWESQKLPDVFSAPLRSLDVVWAPSSYCARAFEATAECLVHVVHYPVSVSQLTPYQPRRQQAKRALGLNEDDRFILYSFDATSYLTRKNPGALVRAFNDSALAFRGWRLVLKTKHLTDDSVDSRALVELVESSAGVIVVDRLFSLDAARALLDAADVYASPHSSEGFGLTIAEAMAHGKVVVASDFGGSRDYFDETCGIPVACQAWELSQDEGPYRCGTIWGRIDEVALTRALLQAVDLNEEERAELGKKARRRIQDQLSPAAVARQMQASIDVLMAG